MERRVPGTSSVGQAGASRLRSAAIILLLLVYAWRFILPVLMQPQAPRADDFQDYLYAAHQIAVGGDPYLGFIRDHVPWDWSLNSGYIYPFAFASFLVPLTWIPNDLAVRIWLLAVQAMVLLSLVLVYRVIGRPRGAELLTMVAVVTTFFPLASTAWTGAMNPVLLLLLTGAWALWMRRRDLAGGVLVGAATVCKIIPVALVPYFLWRRHWRLCLGIILAGCAGLGLCLVTTSLAHNVYYFTQIVPHLSAGTGYRENQSLAGLAVRLCDPATAEHGGSAGWCGRVVGLPTQLLVLGLVLAVTHRGGRHSLEFALAVAALPLVSTVTWSFHLILLLLPIALLLRHLFAARVVGPWRVRLLAAAWVCFSLLPAFHYALILYPLRAWPGAWNLFPITLTRLLAESYLIGTIILFGTIWQAVRESNRSQATSTQRLAA